MPFFMSNADQYEVVKKKYPSDRFIISQKSNLQYPENVPKIFYKNLKRPENLAEIFFMRMIYLSLLGIVLDL